MAELSSFPERFVCCDWQVLREAYLQLVARIDHFLCQISNDMRKWSRLLFDFSRHRPYRAERLHFLLSWLFRFKHVHGVFYSFRLFTGCASRERAKPTLHFSNGRQLIRRLCSIIGRGGRGGKESLHLSTISNQKLLQPCHNPSW